MKNSLIALAIVSMFGTAMAADRLASNSADSMRTTTPMVRPADRNAAFTNEKDMLEQKLKAGTDRASYKRIIEDNGYRISAINVDKPDYLEYEIVKGTHSLEVQLDFKNGARRATDIDVTSNMWRADSTKRMEKDNSYKPESPLVADPTGRYSDRRYIKDWTSEKERLEAALPPNMKVADYKTKLQKMGYTISSVNDRKPDYVEYEVVKGQNSFEIQIDRDPKTQNATKVDVATNVWDAPGTDRVKEANERK